MSEELPLQGELDSRGAKDVLEYEAMLRDGKGPSSGSAAADMAAAGRASLLQARALHERLEMFLMVMGSRLGHRFKGLLVMGKQSLRFVPRYLTEESLSLPAK